MRAFSRLDLPLTLSALLLLAIGLVILSSVAPELLPIQITAAVIGLTLYLIFSKIDYQIWAQLNKPIYIFSILFLTLPFIFGTAAGGAISWLQLGGISIQPSEITRPFLIIIMAKTLSNSNQTTTWKSIKSLLIILIPAYMIFIQPDFGLTVTIMIGWIGMIVTQKLSLRQITFGLLIILIAIPIGWNILQNYQKNRLLSFVNPDEDPLNTGYNVLQSQIAVGSGQIWGRGLGRGTQSHLRFLPERHTDFIFASMAEEFGLIGSSAILILYLTVFTRFIKAFTLSTDPLAKFIAIGLLSTLLFQTFINIGMNIGIFPVTGVTLPLLSYGGSSLVATFIILGIINNLLTHRKITPQLHIH
jgi:rod shape determining protein RodA